MVSLATLSPRLVGRGVAASRCLHLRHRQTAKPRVILMLMIRLLSRTSGAADYMKMALEAFVMGPAALPTLIHNSKHLQSVSKTL